MADGVPSGRGIAGSEVKAAAGAGPEMARVGRWMPQEEFALMKQSGKVVESRTGTTHVADPSDPSAFIRQAKPGTVYVEFDVPASSVKTTNPGEGWSKIIGPNSLEGRNAARKGQPIPQMPDASNIDVRASRINN